MHRQHHKPPRSSRSVLNLWPRLGKWLLGGKGRVGRLGWDVAVFRQAWLTDSFDFRKLPISLLLDSLDKQVHTDTRRYSFVMVIGIPRLGLESEWRVRESDQGGSESRAEPPPNTDTRGHGIAAPR